MVGFNFSSHFLDLFENTNDFIYYLALNGEIEIANNAWLNCLGYSQEEVIGKNNLEFVHPDYHNKYRKCRELVIANTEIF